MFMLGGYWVYPTIAYQYEPCKMCQINACERAANQRLSETHLVLYYGLDDIILNEMSVAHP